MRRRSSPIAVYPGSFDPVTNGHLDIVKRALTMFDTVIVAVLKNPDKKALFPLSERLELLRKSVADLEGAVVDSFSGLLVDYLHHRGAAIIVKGLRAVSDFEYEFQMALMNRKIDSRIETVFLMTSYRYAFLSSSLIKEVAALGGDISGLVPTCVEARLGEKFGARVPDRIPQRIDME
ncbi:MAG: pantetheine-phosphate adenylyltransferase [Armatimonadetes bacterium]|nr:pantetheine-phosphate adenylyltransferase [Armatimonadota bacterium]